MARVLDESPRFSLICVADPLLPTTPWRTFRTLRAALAARGDAIDAVVVTTPATTHADVAGDALRAGCHVLVEKPLATSSEDAEVLCKLADHNGRVLHVDHTYVHSPRFLAVRNAVQMLGGVTLVESIREHMGGPADVSTALDLLPHDLSIMAGLVPGWEPRYVKATGDATTVHAEFCGASADLKVHLSRVAPDKIRAVAVQGYIAEGRVPWSVLWNDQAALAVRSTIGRSGEVDLIPCGAGEPLAGLVDDFADAIENRESRFPVRATGASGVRVLRWIEACGAAEDLEDGRFTENAAGRILSLANIHAVAGTSSDVAWADADAQFVAGDYEASARWGLKSLAHSVGIFHGAYEVAANLAPQCDPFAAR